ncbi:MAG: hypothetical protein LQ338_008279 [Usnochroma carphineum]|nr:MAG: hypothetical protein LQ338_008279 [Usnochroma carphineum]
MQHALQKLGYKSYHMIEGARNPKAFSYWLEALKAKYAGEGKPYERPEFDKLLQNYSAVTDIPCIMFSDELLAAYPNAKVILTERDVDSWLVSMNKTFYVLFSWKSLYYLAPFDPSMVGPYWKTINFIMNIWTGGSFDDRSKLCQSYRDHYAHIRAVVPQEKILEFKPKDGWEELCTFLGKPIPADEPYPRINQPDNIIKMHTMVWYMVVAKAVQKIGGTIVAVGVAAGAAWYYRYKS